MITVQGGSGSVEDAESLLAACAVAGRMGPRELLEIGRLHGVIGKNCAIGDD